MDSGRGAIATAGTAGLSEAEVERAGEVKLESHLLPWTIVNSPDGRVGYAKEFHDFTPTEFKSTRNKEENKKKIQQIFHEYCIFDYFVNFIELIIRNPSGGYYSHASVYDAMEFKYFYESSVNQLLQALRFLSAYLGRFDKKTQGVFINAAKWATALLLQQEPFIDADTLKRELDQVIRKSNDLFQDILGMMLLSLLQIKEIIEVQLDESSQESDFRKACRKANTALLEYYFPFQKYVHTLLIAEEPIPEGHADHSLISLDGETLSPYFLDLIEVEKRGYYFANIKLLHAVKKQRIPLKAMLESTMVDHVWRAFWELANFAQRGAGHVKTYSELQCFLNSLNKTDFKLLRNNEKFKKFDIINLAPSVLIDRYLYSLLLKYYAANNRGDFHRVCHYVRLMARQGVFLFKDSLPGIYFLLLKIEELYLKHIEYDKALEKEDLFTLGLSIIYAFINLKEKEYASQFVIIVKDFFPRLFEIDPNLASLQSEEVLNSEEWDEFFLAHASLFLSLCCRVFGDLAKADNFLNEITKVNETLGIFFINAKLYFENPDNLVALSAIVQCANEGLSIAQLTLARIVKPYQGELAGDLLKMAANQHNETAEQEYTALMKRREKRNKQRHKVEEGAAQENSEQDEKTEPLKARAVSLPSRRITFASTHKKAPPKFGAAKEREKRDKEEKEEKAKAINAYNERIKREKEDRLRVQSEKRKAKQKKKKGGRGSAPVAAAAAAPVVENQAEEVSDAAIAQPVVVLPQAVVVPAPEKKKEEAEQEQKSQHVQLTAFERDILSRIKKAGPAFYVGGLIRKRLKDANAAVNDLDIVIKITEEKPKEILQKIFPEYEVKETNASNTFKIKTKEGIKIDIRLSEHLPDLEKDALSRDFTLAAAYCDETGLVEDPLESSVVHAKHDVIATIIDAEISFGDPKDKKHLGKGDPIRMLRATRLRANTDYPLSDQITDAIRSKAVLLKKEKPERVNAVLKQSFFDYDNAEKQLEALCEHPELLDTLFIGLKESLEIPKIRAWVLEQFKETNNKEHPSFGFLYETLIIAIALRIKVKQESLLAQLIQANPLFRQQFSDGRKPNYERMMSIISKQQLGVLSSPQAFYQRPQAPAAAAAAAYVMPGKERDFR